MTKTLFREKALGNFVILQKLKNNLENDTAVTTPSFSYIKNMSRNNILS